MVFHTYIYINVIVITYIIYYIYGHIGTNRALHDDVFEELTLRIYKIWSLLLSLGHTHPRIVVAISLHVRVKGKNNSFFLHQTNTISVSRKSA